MTFLKGDRERGGGKMKKKAEIIAPLRHGQKSLKQPKGEREGGGFSRA